MMTPRTRRRTTKRKTQAPTLAGAMRGARDLAEHPEWRAVSARLTAHGEGALRLEGGAEAVVALADLKVPAASRVTGVRVDEFGHGIAFARTDGSEYDVGVDLIRYVLDPGYRRAQRRA